MTIIPANSRDRSCSRGKGSHSSAWRKVLRISVLLLAFSVCATLLFTSCPNAFGYYPTEEDRVASYETNESSPPGAVAAPYFMTRKAGSSDDYSVINGTTVMFSDDHEIIIGTETEGATLYYTTDGSNPDVSSASTSKYSSNVFSLGSSDSVSLKVQGLKALMYPSSVVSLNASVATGTTSTPTFNIAEGTYSSAQSLTMSCSTAGSQLYYEMTTDGSVPAVPVAGTSPQYTSALNLNTAGTTYRIKVVASTAGYFDSNIVELTFVILGYNITYDANSASTGSVPVDSTTYFLGDNVTVLGNTGSLGRTGYGFVGWNTAIDGSGTSYIAGDTFTISSDVTLYPMWFDAQKLLSGDGAASDRFGFSVSLSGDYALIGAVGDDAAGADSGSAYIFVRSGTSWSEQAKLTASDAAAGDSFGFNVSLSGDYALIGAYGDDDYGGNSGSGWIFKHQ